MIIFGWVRKSGVGVLFAEAVGPEFVAANWHKKVWFCLPVLPLYRTINTKLEQQIMSSMIESKRILLTTKAEAMKLVDVWAENILQKEGGSVEDANTVHDNVYTFYFEP